MYLVLNWMCTKWLIDAIFFNNNDKRSSLTILVQYDPIQLKNYEKLRNKIWRKFFGELY